MRVVKAMHGCIYVFRATANALFLSLDLCKNNEFWLKLNVILPLLGTLPSVLMQCGLHSQSVEVYHRLFTSKKN